MASDSATPPAGVMPLMDHLRELRRRLLIAVVAILIGTIVNNPILIVHQALNYIRNEGMERRRAIALAGFELISRPSSMTVPSRLGSSPTIAGMSTPPSEMNSELHGALRAAGCSPNVTASAYTNNFAGATTTTLYGIDTNLDILVTQGNNTGTLGTIGPLGVNVSATLDPAPTADAILMLNQASDWDEFRAAAAAFAVPAQNLVYADREGHIGYQAPGRVPIRIWTQMPIFHLTPLFRALAKGRRKLLLVDGSFLALTDPALELEAARFFDRPPGGHVGHEAAGLDRPCAHQRVPVRLARRYGEG